MRLPGLRFPRRVAGFLMIHCLLSWTSTAAWAQFETRARDSFPEGAYSIALGDFNNDGIPDVAMITGNGFTVALGKGDGSFGEPVTYATQVAYSLAVADFNGDGELDVVVANLVPSSVSVYLGNGDGTFQSVPIDSSTTDGSYFVAVGDFNNSHKPSLAVIDPPYISVMLGNGDGTFQSPSDNDSFPGADWLALADFNNDHNLDVLVTGSFGSSYNVGVLLGNGNGTLQNSITQSIEYVPATVAAGDLNGDGNIDAILAYDLGGVAVFLGNGNGTLQPPVNYSTTGSSYYVLVNDLNLDGKMDVAIPAADGQEGGVDVLWGRGDGTLLPAQFFANTASGVFAIGDLNGDHLPDFVFGNGFLGVDSMLNTGVASFTPTTPLTFPGQLIGTTSAPQSVRLTNKGRFTLSISSIKTSGAFQVTGNTCGSSVAAGARCTLSAAFQPTTPGTFTGVIKLVDSASTRPQFVELLGYATAIQALPESLNFGSQEVGSRSAPQVVTVTNEGGAQVEFSSIYVGGVDKKDFSQNTDCTGIFLQPGASCQIKVIFDPTATGARSAALYLTVQGGVSPTPVVLSGTGT